MRAAATIVLSMLAGALIWHVIISYVFLGSDNESSPEPPPSAEHRRASGK